ncbi:GDP-Man:Man(3)GlcNAc(2)-PP-Dol alpha-1,2-mannosyltransferase [Hypsizygus marmoreus]|uniref:GDP-Man:Man(3)GlcNAc(2)-PP-Dol alpha-1,2-mannosyltransferase n=1 Tax=Hypsizygus marmoreus TaxID=39966 RepID=A0A369J2T0_HYPMA|nr:GDP-Man:Man(3)GlcNAc(2)-PP-Dol alpha-1,2-mannosyltransferase [Hypsizygus marmoreus]
MIVFPWFLLCFLLGPWLLITLYSRQLRTRNRQRRLSVLTRLGASPIENKRLVGFFHPFCNAGGGGERVLWTAIAALQRTEHDVVSVVYSGDVDASKIDIIAKVKARFDITLDPSALHFVFLQSRSMIEDSTWPRFTLLGQSFGSMYLAWEAMTKLIPDLYIDTMGYAFTFHIVSLLGRIPIGAYVHYPTISTDMLARVKSRKKWHTNTDAISTSAILSWGKLLYYRIFMYHYARSLRIARFLMVNSSWTKNHVDAILQHSDPLLELIHAVPPLLFLRLFIQNAGLTSAGIVYPPCDTREMAKFALEGRERIILSVAQFRPEKDHPAQLAAFERLLRAHPEYAETDTTGVKLVLLGGSRNAGDAARVEGLRLLAQELGIEDHVQFVVNASYPDMLKWLSRASIGLSTMVDEHFGINVVEFMAAGLIPVAHASGGPLKDIIVPFNGEPTGYHAGTPETFADVLHIALTLSPDQDLAMRRRARAWAVQKFSEAEFEKAWNASGWRSWLP